MKRKTRRKEGMPSKELLLVRLHVSGWGLEPRWLLNRLRTKTVLIDTTCSHKSFRQVLRKAEEATEAKRATAVETRKVKEVIARARCCRARCWKGSLLWGLKKTGELLICFSWEYIKYAAYPNVTFSSSETLVLPSVTFLAVGLYAFLAIRFYNSDG